MEAGVAGPGRPVGTGVGPDAGGAATAAQTDGRVTKARVLNLTADPAPLGLCGFALTTFVLSVFNADLVGRGGLPVVLGLALAYGGIAQLFAGMWSFRRGDTFAALAFSSYGAFWISFWALEAFYVGKVPAADAGHAVGLYLWGWAIFTGLLWLASFARTAAVNAVLLALTVTYILLAIGFSGGHDGIVKAGGWAGIVTAGLAWYTAFAELLEGTYGREILPLIPLRKGGRAPSLGEVHREY